VRRVEQVDHPGVHPLDDPHLQRLHEPGDGHPEVVPDHEHAPEADPVALPQRLHQGGVVVDRGGVEVLLELVEEDRDLAPLGDVLAAPDRGGRRDQVELGRQGREPTAQLPQEPRIGLPRRRLQVHRDDRPGQPAEQRRLHPRRLPAPGRAVHQPDREREGRVAAVDPVLPEPGAVRQPVPVARAGEEAEEVGRVALVERPRPLRRDQRLVVVGRRRRGDDRDGRQRRVPRGGGRAVEHRHQPPRQLAGRDIPGVHPLGRRDVQLQVRAGEHVLDPDRDDQLLLARRPLDLPRHPPRLVGLPRQDQEHHPARLDRPDDGRPEVLAGGVAVRGEPAPHPVLLQQRDQLPGRRPVRLGVADERVRRLVRARRPRGGRLGRVAAERVEPVPQVFGEVGRGRVPVGRPPGERPQADAVQLLRHPVVQQPRRAGLVVGDPVEHLGGGRAVERPAAGEQLV